MVGYGLDYGEFYRNLPVHRRAQARGLRRTVNRRTLGRGRIIAGIGSILALVACLFPWGQTAGIGLPPERTGAFDGFGILVFVAAIGLLALIALPYAAGDQPMALTGRSRSGPWGWWASWGSL